MLQPIGGVTICDGLPSLATLFVSIRPWCLAAFDFTFYEPKSMSGEPYLLNFSVDISLWWDGALD
jgi:hypothetical protein